MRKNSGITAFELAVTLAIMTIVAAMVMPPYLKWLRASRLRGAVNNLVADLELAKVRAIRANSFVAVEFNGRGYSVFLDNGAGGSTAGDWLRSGDEELIRDRDLPAGVRIDLDSLTFSDNRTRFNGRGIPPDVTTSETILLVNASGNRQVILNRLGHLDIQ